MKVLNLFSGIGGNRFLWSRNLNVIAVDNNAKVLEEYKKLFIDDKIIYADAYSWVEEYYKDYDIIWASPPCRTHSSLGRAAKKRLPDFRLYSLIVFLIKEFKGKWVVENVKPYYRKLLNIKGKEIGRHTFWSNVELNDDIVLPKFNGNFTKSTTNVKDYLSRLEEFLGFKIESRIYMYGNHDPGQVYRNCVHPKLGKFVLDQIMS